MVEVCFAEIFEQCASQNVYRGIQNLIRLWAGMGPMSMTMS